MNICFLYIKTHYKMLLSHSHKANIIISPSEPNPNTWLLSTQLDVPRVYFYPTLWSNQVHKKCVDNNFKKLHKIFSKHLSHTQLAKYGLNVCQIFCVAFVGRDLKHGIDWKQTHKRNWRNTCHFGHRDSLYSENIIWSKPLNWTWSQTDVMYCA